MSFRWFGDRAEAAIIRGAERGLERAAAEVESRAKSNVRGRTRSGTLTTSITFERAGELRYLIGSNVVYSRIQELGGTVTPKSGKFLTIPVGPAVTPAGVARFKSARQVPGLTFVQTKGGQALLGKDKRGGEFEVWYILVPRSVIPARPYLRPALNSVASKLDDFIGDGVRDELARLP